MDQTIAFRDHLSVELKLFYGDDQEIADAARVSGNNDVKNADKPIDKLIPSLMKHRHGTPFEHVGASFIMEAPIFVAREFNRHRMGSISEQSARYALVPGTFYALPADREKRPIMAPDGFKPMAPKFEAASLEAHTRVRDLQRWSAKNAWVTYVELLSMGVAMEVARNVLPVSIFTRWRYTTNLRAWMNFLSLRVIADNSTYETFPQMEIDNVAKAIELQLSYKFPIAMKAFNDNGRVAP